MYVNMYKDHYPNSRRRWVIASSWGVEQSFRVIPEGAFIAPSEFG